MLLCAMLSQILLEQVVTFALEYTFTMSLLFEEYPELHDFYLKFLEIDLFEVNFT